MHMSRELSGYFQTVTCGATGGAGPIGKFFKALPDSRPATDFRLLPGNKPLSVPAHACCNPL